MHPHFATNLLGFEVLCKSASRLKNLHSSRVAMATTVAAAAVTVAGRARAVATAAAGWQWLWQ